MYRKKTSYFVSKAISTYCINDVLSAGSAIRLYILGKKSFKNRRTITTFTKMLMLPAIPILEVHFSRATVPLEDYYFIEAACTNPDY